MEREETKFRMIEGKYEENCLEEFFGDELIWNKEINDKGEVVENLLLQEVDGGVRGVDVFGNEHFDQAEWDRNTLHLYQDGKIIKRYARDDRGNFRRADENDQIIYPKTVDHYQPIVAAALKQAKNGPQGIVLLQSIER